MTFIMGAAGSRGSRADSPHLLARAAAIAGPELDST